MATGKMTEPDSNATSNKPKKILITGSSGYVGQHLVASLGLLGPQLKTKAPETPTARPDETEACKYELFCAFGSLPTFEDDLKCLFGLNYGSLLGASRLHPSIVNIKPIGGVDLADPNLLSLLLEHCGPVDAVVHLAAMSSPASCEKNPERAWKVNCPTGLLSLGAPIIYLSTDQVYEGTKEYYEEGAETLPINVYGKTKLAFERALIGVSPLLSDEENGGDSSPVPDSASIQASKLHPKSVALRSSLILGPPTPFLNGCRKAACPSFLQFVEGRLKSSTPTDYFANEYRSVVHVDDVILAIKHFLFKALFDESLLHSRNDKGTGDKLPQTQVYNLGGNDRVTRFDLALAIASHLQLDSSSAKGVDRPAFSPGGGGVPSPPDISMNVSKLAKELDIPNMKGLQDIVASSLTGLPPLFRYASRKLERSKCHTTFSASHPPALKVRPGEIVHVETWDCFYGACFEKASGEVDGIVEEMPQPLASPEKVKMDYSTMNPVTGPIFVEGAMPGDILSITLHHIRPRLRGVAANYGPGSGQLGHKVCRSCFRYFTIDSDRTSVTMDLGREENDGNNCQLPPVSFPCQPMLGVIGLAPLGNENIRTVPAGKHGGNLDNKVNGIGSTIHIQVNHPGGLLSIGDMHASQGDGEICGTGVEVSGDVLLSCSIIKGVKSDYPVTETATHWVTHGVAVEDIPFATTIASQEAAKLLVDQWGFTIEDACIFLGVACDLGLCQAIHPDKGTVIAKMAVPKITACPFPFRCQSQ